MFIIIDCEHISPRLILSCIFIILKFELVFKKYEMEAIMGHLLRCLEVTPPTPMCVHLLDLLINHQVDLDVVLEYHLAEIEIIHFFSTFYVSFKLYKVGRLIDGRK